MPDALLSLPWQIQLSLASGYAAYLLCYAGIRAKHTAVDVTFLTLTFGLIASGCYFLILSWAIPAQPAQTLIEIISKYRNGLPAAEMKPSVLVTSAASLAAFFITCASGILWRKYLRSLVRKALRRADVSWSDDDPNALSSIIYDSKRRLSQIAVLLDDDTWLRCDRLAEYENAPFGPCKIGADGDVALYVTHVEEADGTVKDLKSVRDPDYGDRITFVPASKIKRINFRHAP